MDAGAFFIIAGLVIILAAVVLNARDEKNRLIRNHNFSKFLYEKIDEIRDRRRELILNGKDHTVVPWMDIDACYAKFNNSKHNDYDFENMIVYEELGRWPTERNIMPAGMIVSNTIEIKRTFISSKVPLEFF